MVSYGLLVFYYSIHGLKAGSRDFARFCSTGVVYFENIFNDPPQSHKTGRFFGTSVHGQFVGEWNTYRQNRHLTGRRLNLFSSHGATVLTSYCGKIVISSCKQSQNLVGLESAFPFGNGGAKSKSSDE